MPTQAKRETIDSLVELLKKSDAVFVTEYRGLTVEKITACRRGIREAGGEMKVCKNTLMRIALKECDMPLAEGMDTGPNGYVMSYGDSVSVAKAIRDFAKQKGNEALIIKGGILGGELLSKEQVMALASLPSREELIAQAVGSIASPLRGLVTVLSGTARGLVTCLSQIKEQKEKDAA